MATPPKAEGVVGALTEKVAAPLGEEDPLGYATSIKDDFAEFYSDFAEDLREVPEEGHALSLSIHDAIKHPLATIQETSLEVAEAGEDGLVDVIEALDPYTTEEGQAVGDDVHDMLEDALHPIRKKKNVSYFDERPKKKRKPRPASSFVDDEELN